MKKVENGESVLGGKSAYICNSKKSLSDIRIEKNKRLKVLGNHEISRTIKIKSKKRETEIEKPRVELGR